MFLILLQLKHTVWAIKFEADSLAEKDARSAFIQCISKSLMLTQMKHHLIQTNIEQAFLDLIRNSVRRTELKSKRHPSQQMPRASWVRQVRSEPKTSGQAASAHTRNDVSVSVRGRLIKM